ncbi:alpha/beta hydrolase [Yinghuangia soli]|uniref:Acyl-CoA:diacylglycerol acyltransferase n=1 Tax=Yinghuangia soli TaxID=2908204 RepID=A0AA41PUX3_9ACTN|nr:alpha/beta hydrolase family protein [Yinghuangia soli]MCF2526315.1 esterase family protein [Yinghuangia soli]
MLQVPRRRSRRIPRRRLTGWSLVLAVLAPLLGLGVAAGPAANATANPATVWWEAFPNTPVHPNNSTATQKRIIDIGINSPSTGAPVKWVRVLLPVGWSKTATRTWPTLWMLHGGGDNHTSYTDKSSIQQMVLDKDVMVVMPETSPCSSYSNWYNGNNEALAPDWEDYIIEEVSQILESQYRASGDRAVLGISMGGGGAMTLAGKHPGHFKSVASLSGAVNMLWHPGDTSEPILGPSIVWASGPLCAPGGVDWKRIWGEPGYPFFTNDPTDLRQRNYWLANSAIHNAEGLRGTPLYLYYGNGSDTSATQPPALDPVTGKPVPDGDITGAGWAWGQLDAAGNQVQPNPQRCLASPPTGKPSPAVIDAAMLERVDGKMNQSFADRLRELGIPFTECAAYGLHSWPYWDREIYAALPMLLGSLGL